MRSSLGLRAIWGLLAVLGLAVLAAPARADLDQRCLHGCLAGGATARVCLPDCSYAAPAAPKRDETQLGSVHDVFVPPQPVAPGQLAGPVRSLLAGTVPAGDEALARRARGAIIGTDASRFLCVTACVRNLYARPLCGAACAGSDDPLVPDRPWLAGVGRGGPGVAPSSP